MFGENDCVRCLIVDDAEFDRRMMRRVIKAQCPHVPVIVARTLAEARQRLETMPIGMIFLDNILPDGQGIDFIPELSANPATRHIPVVLVSDFPTPFMFAKARAANVRAVWSKRDFLGPAVQQVVVSEMRLAS